MKLCLLALALLFFVLLVQATSDDKKTDVEKYQDGKAGSPVVLEDLDKRRIRGGISFGSYSGIAARRYSRRRRIIAARRRIIAARRRIIAARRRYSRRRYRYYGR